MPYYNPLQPAVNVNNLSGMDALNMTPPQPVDLGIPIEFRQNNTPPWDPTNLKEDERASSMETPAANSFNQEALLQSSPASSGSSSYGGHWSASSRSPEIKMEKAPSPIRKIKGSGKIEKKRAEPASKFVIMTPNIINAAAGKPNPFECFEAMRTTHRGRKGPLANEVKESALQVRRLGACFCCHARKVKV